MKKISICIPNYNRYEFVIEAISQVIDDNRIGEIVICDDASTDDCVFQLAAYYYNHKKVKIYENKVNVDCYYNKKRAIELAKNKWVIILDSDNIIDKSYLDIIYSYNWRRDIAYMPSFAAPLFSYKDYEGVFFSKENIAQYIDLPMVETCCNCMNYFVNKSEYIRVWKNDINPHTSDSLYQNYNWLKEDNMIFIVPNLTYQHRVHDQSHYRLNNHKSGNLCEELKQKLREIK